MKNIYEDPNEKYEKDDSVFVDLHPGRKRAGKIIGIFVIIGVLFVIASLGVQLVSDLKDEFPYSDYYNDDEASQEELSFYEEFDASSVSTIFVGLEYADVSIVEIESDKIEVDVFGDDDLKEKLDVYYANDDTQEEMLCIVDSEYLLGGHNTFTQRPDIYIYVPNDFAGDLLVDLKAGDVAIGEFENAYISVNVESGDVWVGSAYVISSEISYGNFESKKADTIKAVVNLGNITLEDVTCYCELIAECGNVEIENLNLGYDSNIEIGYGNLDIKETNDIKIDCEATLGSKQINGSNPDSPVTLNVNVDCGNVNIN